MTKAELKKHIDLYKETEQVITDLDDKYGINVWDSRHPNFYNNYNLLIHNLLVEIFGDEKTELLEDYMFDQTDITFDELYETIISED